jgi:large subunit ribosomal protein L16
MLQPKRSKYAKSFRGRRRGVATRGSSLAFGDYGLKAQEAAWVTASQLEAARKTIAHGLRKGGRVWIRVFPDKAVSGRPAGKRMGGGKGEIARYVVVVTPGKILFEIAGTTSEIAKEALIEAAAKLPIGTVIVSKENE